MQRLLRLAAALAILLFCVVELGLRRPARVTDDWHGWRQADTQAIARNLAFVEADLLRPRIDWGGDGPGYVEAEMPLYPAVVALALRAVGDREWPGQLLSLACVAAAAALLFRELERRHGAAAAFVATAALLGSRGPLVIGTSIQPDSLSFLLFTAGFINFLRFLERDGSAPSSGEARAVLAWAIPTALAGLVKPTTLELGLAQGLLVLLRRRDLLLRPSLWLGWSAVVVPVLAWLLHARGLYLAHGNTFGVLSGGDSKLPVLDRLLDAGAWVQLFRYEIVWGTGPLAVPAGLYLLVRGRVTAVEASLAYGALALDVLAFRYTSHRFGTHYHLPHAILGAVLVAHAAADLLALRALRPSLARASIGLAAVASLAALFFGRGTLRELRALPPEPETALGDALVAHAAPGTLVAVRARAPRINETYRTENNFQDPRIFYLSRTRGFVLAEDDPGADRLAAARDRGARYYVHVGTIPKDAALVAWLEANADPVATLPEGEVYRLRAPDQRAGDPSRTR